MPLLVAIAMRPRPAQVLMFFVLIVLDLSHLIYWVRVAVHGISQTELGHS